MKKIIALILVSIIAIPYSFAQDSASNTTHVNIPKSKKIMKPSRDFVLLEFGYANWNKTPDSVNVSGFGRSFSAYICYDFPIKKSNFSFAAGLGVRSDNIYFKDQHVVMNTNAAQVTFVNIDTATSSSYKRIKLSTAYLEAPFELRYFGNKENRNRGFKFALGMKVGLLVNAHTKEREDLAGPYINDKVVTKRYVETWSFAPSARIGWGNFSVYANYNISQLFNAGQGPEVYPFSIGLCLSGL